MAPNHKRSSSIDPLPEDVMYLATEINSRVIGALSRMAQKLQKNGSNLPQDGFNFQTNSSNFQQNGHFEHQFESPDSPELPRREPESPEPFVRAEGFEKELLDFEKSPLANLDISRISPTDEDLDCSNLILKQPTVKPTDAPTDPSDETNYLKVPLIVNRTNRIYQTVNQLLEEKKENQGEIEELKKQIASLESKLNSSQNENQSLRSQNILLKSRVENQVASEMKDFNEKEDLYKRTINSKDQEISCLEKRIQGLLTRQRHDAEVNQRRVRDLENQLAAANEKINAKKSEINCLVETVSKQSSEIISLEFKLRQQSALIAENSKKKPSVNFSNHSLTFNGQSPIFAIRRLLHLNKSLIYQKQYLIFRMKGFEQNEKVNLRMLAMINSVSYDSIESLPLTSSKSKFRSLVIAVISISRMKFLVKKWTAVKQIS